MLFSCLVDADFKDTEALWIIEFRVLPRTGNGLSFKRFCPASSSGQTR